MSPDDDDLKSLWQTSPSIDIDDLLARVSAERKRMTRLIWLEIIGTVLGVALIIYFDRINVFGEHRLFFWLLLALSFALQIWMWWWRRGLWSAVSQSPMDLLKLQLKRARVGLRVARWYAYGTPACALFGLVMGRFVTDELPALDLSNLARGILLASMVSLIVVVTALGVGMMRRYQARIDWITARIAQLSETGE